MGTILIITLIASALFCVASLVASTAEGAKLSTAIAVNAALGTLAVLGVFWPVYPLAHAASQESAVNGYKQFLNGTVVSADVRDDECYKAKESSGGSNCSHTYRCDSYTELEHYQESYQDTEYYTDTNGKRQSRSVTKYRDKTRWVTKWHDCPYVTHEYTYTVKAVAWHEFKYTIASHVFAQDPQPWDRSERIPGNVFRGVPPQWQRAKDGLATGYAAAITVEDEYANYILSSEDTILKAASDKIEILRKANLLPLHTARLTNDPIYDQYLADKMSFVGFTASNAATWQDMLMRMNAMLGTKYQGDMHIVAVKASAIPASVSQRDYANALKAYWLNDLEKRAFAKNGIGVVLGVDDSGSTIQWAEAFTGMPIGNGAMLSRLNTALQNVPFDPNTVIGMTGARVTALQPKPKVEYTAASGLIPQAVMVDFPFKRACMGCEGDEDKGQHGFVDLKDEIPIGGGGKAFGSIIWVILIASAWFFATGGLQASASSFSSELYGNSP